MEGNQARIWTEKKFIEDLTPVYYFSASLFLGETTILTLHISNCKVVLVTTTTTNNNN